MESNERCDLVKCEREREKLNHFAKKELELDNLEYSQPIHITKMERVCSEEKIKGMAKQLFDKEVK